MLATCSDDGIAITFSPFLKTPTASTPKTVPGNQPFPRCRSVPPTITAAIASNSMPIAAIGWPEFIRPVSSSAANPDMKPASAYTET